MRHVDCLLAVVCLVIGAGCSKDNTVDAGKNVQAGIGAQCSGANDPGCGVGAVCVLGYCRSGCTTDAECPTGTLCIGDSPPWGCQLPDETQCNDTDKVCKQPLVCGLDKTCRMSCEGGAVCPRNEQECIAGTCVSKGEKDAMATWFSCTAGEKRCSGADIQECNTVAPGFVTTSSCAAPTPSCVGKGQGCGAPGCCSNDQPCNAADGYGLYCVGGACQPEPELTRCWDNSSCAAGQECIGALPNSCPPGVKDSAIAGRCIASGGCNAACDQCISCGAADLVQCLGDPNCLDCLQQTGSDRGDTCMVSDNESTVESTRQAICQKPGCSCESLCAATPPCSEKDAEPNVTAKSWAVDPQWPAEACTPATLTFLGTLRGPKDRDSLVQTQIQAFTVKGACTHYDVALTAVASASACVKFWTSPDVTMVCGPDGEETVIQNIGNMCCTKSGVTSMSVLIDPPPTDALVVVPYVAGLEAGKACVDYTYTVNVW